MSALNALIRRGLVLSLAFTATACATVPDNSSMTPMKLGAAIAPPRGFVEFCERLASECGTKPAELQAMVATVDQSASSPASAAIQYDWSAVFAKDGAARASAPKPMLISAPALGAPPSAEPVDAANALAFAPPEHTPELWRLITTTNDRINRAIAQRSDMQVYGKAEYWALPLETGVNAGDCEDFVLEKRHALIAAGVPAQALSIAVVKTVRGETHAVLLVATSRGEFVLDSLTPWVLPWNQARYEWRERQVAGSASHWAMADLGSPSDQTPRPQSQPKLLFASLQ